MPNLVCPKCGSENNNEIIYGYVNMMPVVSESDDESVDDGPYFGGCIVEEDGPTRHCDDINLDNIPLLDSVSDNCESSFWLIHGLSHCFSWLEV